MVPLCSVMRPSAKATYNRSICFSFKDFSRMTLATSFLAKITGPVVSLSSRCTGRTLQVLPVIS
ncbi:hypothetical protein D3C75_751150 [compost metagenome]